MTTLSYKRDKDALRVARRREGRYPLRTILKETDPAKLWENLWGLKARLDSTKTVAV